MPRFRVRISRRASREMDQADIWWLEHRDKAPKALNESIDEAIEKIREQPGIGEIARYRIKKRGVRRIYLPRVGYHIYYRVLDDMIEILSLWHSSRRSLPRL